MTDIFAIRSETQRRIVVGALVVYVALFAADLTTELPLVGAASDLVVALLVLSACAVGLVRISRTGGTDPVAVGTVTALAIAGVSIGYQGLATLGLLASSVTIEMVGSLALFAAIGLYLYDQYA